MPSQVGDSFAVPCHQMLPDAAAERHQTQPLVARRPPEGRQKDARRLLGGQQMIVRWRPEGHESPQEGGGKAATRLMDS